MHCAAVCCTMLFLLLTACSQKEAADNAAQQAARDYYSLLLDEHGVEDFVEGICVADSLPDGYREQLLVAVQQHISNIEQQHGGLNGVVLSETPQHADSRTGVVDAFITLQFADSTQEEIVVPMTKRGEKWLMYYSGL